MRSLILTSLSTFICYTAFTNLVIGNPLISLLPKLSGNVIRCEVAILGAGFAGTYAAYELAEQYGPRLCLIEQNERFGGRIYDVSAEPGGPVFGVGALRVTSAQFTMLNLSQRLGMKLEVQESDVELLKVRGEHFYRDITNKRSDSKKMCETVFRNLNCSLGNSTETDMDLLALLVQTYLQNRTVVSHYADFPTYIQSMFGDEGLAFIRESIRYNSPFTSVSSQGILEFFINEFRDMGLDPERYYPAGGMSQYIIKMLDHAKRHNVKFHLNHTVHSIDYSDSDYRFIISTDKHKILAGRVLCAIDPYHFRMLKGNVALKIQAAEEFNMIVPKQLAIVTAWWRERWWERSKFYRNLSRVVSHENCFNTMDIPTFPYGRDQNVTRAVYDDGACVELWKMFAQTFPEKKDLLKKTVVSSLQLLFTDIVVPEPWELHIYVHENAWHFQIPKSNLTNDQIFKWSHRPLPNNPKFSLIGEGYNLDFTAWCDGALKSTMHVLTKFYGFNFPCLYDVGSPAICPNMTRVRMRASYASLFG